MRGGLGILAQLALALGYAWLAWTNRRGWAAAAESPAAQAAGVGPRGAGSLGLPLGLLALAHLAVLVQGLLEDGHIDFGFGNALSTVGLIMVALLWAGARLQPVPGLAVLVLPIAALCVLASAVPGRPHLLAYPGGALAALHLSLALVAFCTLAIAALQALLLMAFERRLHHAAARLPDGAMPPLLTLERYLFRLVWIGFALLTLTLVSGAFFSEVLFGQPVRLNHKTIFTLLSWAIFAVLLFGRVRYGWRGRRALRWVVAGSALVLVGYVGSKFVLEVLLAR